MAFNYQHLEHLNWASAVIVRLNIMSTNAYGDIVVDVIQKDWD